MPTVTDARAAAQQLLNSCGSFAQFADCLHHAETIVEWAQLPHKQLPAQQALQVFESLAQAAVAVLQLLCKTSAVQQASAAVIEDACIVATVTMLGAERCWVLASDASDSKAQAILVVRMTGLVEALGAACRMLLPALQQFQPVDRRFLSNPDQQQQQQQDEHILTRSESHVLGLSAAVLRTCGLLIARWQWDEVLKEPWGQQLSAITAVVCALLRHPGIKRSSRRTSSSSGEQLTAAEWAGVKKAAVCAASLFSAATFTLSLPRKGASRELITTLLQLQLMAFSGHVSSLWQKRQGKSGLRVPANPTLRGKEALALQPPSAVPVVRAHEALQQALGMVLPQNCEGLWGQKQFNTAQCETTCLTFASLLTDYALKTWECCADGLIPSRVLPVFVEVLLLSASSTVTSEEGQRTWERVVAALQCWQGKLYYKVREVQEERHNSRSSSSSSGGGGGELTGSGSSSDEDSCDGSNDTSGSNSSDSAQQQFGARVDSMVLQVLPPLLHKIVPAALHAARQQQQQQSGSTGEQVVRSIGSHLGAVIVLLLCSLKECSPHRLPELAAIIVEQPLLSVYSLELGVRLNQPNPCFSPVDPRRLALCYTTSLCGVFDEESESSQSDPLWSFFPPKLISLAASDTASGLLAAVVSMLTSALKVARGWDEPMPWDAKALVVGAAYGACNTTAQLLVKARTAPQTVLRTGKQGATTNQLSASGWASLLQLAGCALVTMAQTYQMLAAELQADIAHQRSAGSSSSGSSGESSGNGCGGSLSRYDLGNAESAVWWLENYLLVRVRSATESLVLAVGKCLDSQAQQQQQQQQQLLLLLQGLPNGVQEQLLQQANAAATWCLDVLADATTEGAQPPPAAKADSAAVSDAAAAAAGNAFSKLQISDSCVSGSGGGGKPGGSSSSIADVCPVLLCAAVELCPVLTPLGEGLMSQFPAIFTCNNPQCTNMSQATEFLCASKVCSRCQVAHYCSAACLEAHWQQHRKVCKWIAASAGSGGSSSSSRKKG